MGDDTTALLSKLKQISLEQNYPNPGIKISPISTGGANFTSRLYLITITSSGKNDLKLFAKISAMGEEIRKQIKMDLYKCERFIYTELMQIYRILEDRFCLPEKHKLAVPKFYGADATRLRQIVVLEDLSCRGFILHNRLEPVSWEYAAAAVTELAKFHSLSLAFQRNYPDEFNKTANKFKCGIFTDDPGCQQFFNNSVKSALAAVREEHKEKLQKFVDGMSLFKFCSFYEPLQRTVLIHSDFKPSNLLYRVKKEGETEVIVVDYQMIQAGCPVIDLLYFVFTATDGQFRARYYQQLIDHYYRELGAALARVGLHVDQEYSRKDFDYDLREKLPFGLHLSVLLLPLLLLDEKKAISLDEEFNISKFAVEATGDIYKRRFNEAVDDYVAWGILA